MSEQIDPGDDMQVTQDRRALNWNAILLAFIGGLPATLGALAAVFMAWGTMTKVDKVAEKVEVVHENTNSMKDDLISTTRSDARQEGYTQGAKDQRAVDKAKK